MIILGLEPHSEKILGQFYYCDDELKIWTHLATKISNLKEMRQMGCYYKVSPFESVRSELVGMWL